MAWPARPQTVCSIAGGSNGSLGTGARRDDDDGDGDGDGDDDDDRDLLLGRAS